MDNNINNPNHPHSTPHQSKENHPSILHLVTACKDSLYQNTSLIKNLGKFHVIKMENEEEVESDQDIMPQNEELVSAERNVQVGLAVEQDELSQGIQFLEENVAALSAELSKAKGNQSKMKAEWNDAKLFLIKQTDALEGLFEGLLVIVKALKAKLECSQNAHKVDVEKFQKELNEADSKFQSLKSQLESSQTETNELRGENSTYSNQINCLVSDKKSVDMKVKSLEKQIQKLTKKREKSDCEFERGRQETIESLKSKINDFEKNFKDFEVEHENFAKKESKLKEENRKLEEKLKSVQLENKQLTSDASNLKGETKKLGEQLKITETERIELLEKLNDIEGEKLRLINEQKEVDGENLKLLKEVTTLNTEKEKLSQEVQELKLKATQTEKEKQLLIANHNDEVQELGHKSSQATIRFEVSSQAVEALKSELVESKKIFTSKVELLEQELENERAQKLSEIESLKLELKGARANCDKKSETIMSLRKLSADFEAESNQVKHLINEVKTLKLNQDYLKGQLDGKFKEIEKLNSTNKSLEKQMNELRISNEEFTQLDVEQKSMIQLLERKLEDNRTLTNQQGNELETQKLAMGLMEKSIQNYKETISKLEVEVEKQKELLNTEKNRVKFFSSQLQTTVSKNDNLQTELSAEKKKSQDKIQDLKERIDELNEEISSLREREIEAKNQKKFQRAQKKMERAEKKLERAKLHFTISSDSNTKGMNDLLLNTSSDELPEIPTTINPPPKNKTDMPNHDGTSKNFHAQRKRSRMDADLTRAGDREGIDGEKSRRSYNDPIPTEKIFEAYLKDLHEGKL